MNGFGSYSKYNIDEIIKKLEKQISNIKTDYSRDVVVLKNQLSSCAAELEQLKIIVNHVDEYTQQEYNKLNEKLNYLNDEIEDIKTKLNTIQYNEILGGKCASGINEFPIYARYAEKDTNGNIIPDYYAAKSDLSSVSSTLSADYTKKIAESSSAGMSALSSVSAQLVEHIENEAQERQAKDQELYGAISSESATRAAKDNELETTISSVSSDLSLTINDNYNTLTTNLERETQERSEADIIMNNAIMSETSRALQSESNLDTKIDNEISRSTNKDIVLEQKINTEQNRAETAETNLQEALSNETTRASTAETELLTDLNNEIERATNIESGLRTDLDNEISRATESETTIQTTLQENIDNEVTRATNAENTLQSNIDSEATLRESTDNTIQTNLSNEITRATGVEEGLRTDLSAETTRATGVETTLTTNLNDEISNRETADRDLQVQIDTIEATQNIVDIVVSYAELELYDTTHLSNNDKIQVLQDERVGGSTIYTWNKDENKWDFIGEFGPYYTISETDDLLNTKQNNLSAGDGINITNDIVSHSIKIIENNNTEDIVEDTVFTVHLKNNHYKIITFDKTITEIKFMIEQSPVGILQETGFEFTVPEDSDLETLSFEVIDLPAKKIYTIIPDSYTPPNIYQGTIVNYRCTIGEYEVED